MTIWQFSTQLSRRLLAWAGFSIAVGAALAAQKSPFLQGFGAQFAGWGAVDALIALIGARSSGRKQQAADAHAPATLAAETRKLRRLLWLNTGLDVLYVLGGYRLARGRGATDDAWRGHGWGIIVQGGFLFWFDLLHALRLGREPAVSQSESAAGTSRPAVP